jgi:hypothetical protein
MAAPLGSPCSPSYPVLWQGLLPLTELSIYPLEGSREHAFQITGVWWASPNPALGSVWSCWRGNFPVSFWGFQAQPLQSTWLLCPHLQGHYPPPSSFSAAVRLSLVSGSTTWRNRWLSWGDCSAVTRHPYRSPHRSVPGICHPLHHPNSSGLPLTSSSPGIPWG